MENQMFCFQCQETAGCSGCTVRGVCGKTAEVARMQDLLIYVTKGLSAVTTKLREAGKSVEIAVDYMVNDNLFTTITNANFDDEAIKDAIEKSKEYMQYNDENEGFCLGELFKDFKFTNK